MANGLAIRRVVLYKHGVGYFERQGEVSGDAVVHLDFKARDMNDVLKSMTVLDLSGGTISAVSYDSTKPLEKLLEEATIRIPDQGSLSALLAQVKGARIRARVGGQEVTGAIIGLESADIPAGETSVARSFLTLHDGGTLRTFDLLEVKDLTFLDEAVRRDLDFYLSTVLSSYKKDTKRVAVFATGRGQRELFAAYTLEAPVWKTSYRVLLDEQGKPTVQGWAVVDNTGDEDWVDVSLTLIAGLPISFRHDLYSPRYLTRPEVRVQTESAAAPVMIEEGIMAEEEFGAGVAAGPPMEMAKKRAIRPMMAAAAPAPGRPSPMADMAAVQRSANVQTVTQEVGDLFEYRVAQPVTVRRNQSALVPILHQEMEGRRVLLYNRASREKNPFSALEITDSSALTLEGGPLTVSDAGLYVGEAMLDTLKPGDRRIVPFAVELGCRVLVDDKREQGQIFKAVLARGVLTTQAWAYRRTRYTFQSKSAKARALYVEHPRLEGWELFDTPAPVEKTERIDRFRLELEAGAKLEFVVSERSVASEQVHVGDFGRDRIGYYLSSKLIDEKTARILEEVANLRERLAQLTAESEQLEQKRQTIHEDQERIRQNITALKSGAEQRQLLERLVKKLDAQESQLEELDAKLAKLEEERARLEQEADSTLNGLRYTAELGEKR